MTPKPLRIDGIFRKKKKKVNYWGTSSPLTTGNLMWCIIDASGKTVDTITLRPLATHRVVIKI